MAAAVNVHINDAERKKWDQTPVDLKTHVDDTAKHLPRTPSSTDYYLGVTVTTRGGTVSWLRL